MKVIRTKQDGVNFIHDMLLEYEELFSNKPNPRMAMAEAIYDNLLYGHYLREKPTKP